MKKEKITKQKKVEFDIYKAENLGPYDRSVSKCYPKSDAAPPVEKSSTSRAFHSLNT